MPNLQTFEEWKQSKSSSASSNSNSASSSNSGTSIFNRIPTIEEWSRSKNTSPQTTPTQTNTIDITKPAGTTSTVTIPTVTTPKKSDSYYAFKESQLDKKAQTDNRNASRLEALTKTRDNYASKANEAHMSYKNAEAMGDTAAADKYYTEWQTAKDRRQSYDKKLKDYTKDKQLTWSEQKAAEEKLDEYGKRIQSLERNPRGMTTAQQNEYNVLIDEYNKLYDKLQEGSRTAFGKKVSAVKAGAAGFASGAVETAALSTAGQNQAAIAAAKNPNQYLLENDPEYAALVKQGQEAIAAGQTDWTDSNTNKLYGAADKLAEKQAVYHEEATKGATTFGKVTSDIVENMVQMAGDAVVGRTLGVDPLAVMALRTYGSGAQEARQGGYDQAQQMFYGTLKAGVEAGTEKLFDGFFGVYGKGTADEFTENLIKKLAKESKAGNALLTMVFGALGEANEEAISGLLDPVIGMVLEGTKSVTDAYGTSEGRKKLAADVGYSMLIGGLCGLIGSGGKAANILASKGISVAEQQAIKDEVLAEQQKNGNTPEQLMQNAEAQGEKTIPQSETQTETAVEQNAKTPTAEEQAVKNLIADGVSNSKADAILADPALRAVAEAAIGQPITGTKSEQRSIIKQNLDVINNYIDGITPVAPITEESNVNADTSNNPEIIANESNVSEGDIQTPPTPVEINTEQNTPQETQTAINETQNVQNEESVKTADTLDDATMEEDYKLLSEELGITDADAPIEAEKIGAVEQDAIDAVREQQLASDEKARAKAEKDEARVLSDTQKAVDDFKKKTLPTEYRSVRRNDVYKLAQGLKDYIGKSGMRVGELTDRITEICNTLVRNDGSTLSASEISESIRNLAEEIVDRSTTKQRNETGELRTDYRNWLKNQKIFINPMYYGDFNCKSYGQLNYKFRALNTVKDFVNGALSPDVVLQEAQELFPGLIPNPQGMSSADAMAALWNAFKTHETDYDIVSRFIPDGDFRYYSESVADLSEKISDIIFSEDVRETAPTMMDKANTTIEEQKSTIKSLREEVKQKNAELKEANKQHKADLRDINRQHKAELRQAETDKADAVRATKEAGKKALSNLQQRYREAKIQTAEKNAQKAELKKIDSVVKDLSQRVGRPVNGKFVPVEFLTQITDMLQDLQMSKAGDLDLQLEQKLEQAKVELDNAATEEEAIAILKRMDRMMTSEAKKQTTLDNVLKSYQKVKESSTYGSIYSEEIAAHVESVCEAVGNKPLSQMSAKELGEVAGALKAIQKTVRDAVKVRIGTEERNAHETGISWIREMQNSNSFSEANGDIKGTKLGDGYNAMKAAVGGFFRSYNTPQAAFNDFGGRHADSDSNAMYRVLNEGQTKAIDLKLNGRAIVDSLLSDRKALRGLRKPVTIESIKTDGKATKMSRGMMLSTLMHMYNEQNANHILAGALQIPGIADYYKGRNNNGFSTTQTLTDSSTAEIASLRAKYRQLAEQYDTLDSMDNKNLDWQTNIDSVVTAMDSVTARINEILDSRGEGRADIIKEIEGNLTSYERQWIEKMQEVVKWAQGTLNKTTLDVYGFEKANVDNYFPIQVDSDFRKTTSEGVTRDVSLENSGFMKQRANFASTPIKLLDISDVCENYIDRVAMYSGIMPAVREFGKVWNTVEMNTGTDKMTSVKDTMRTKFGNSGVEYIENLVADLQGGRTIGSSDASGLSRIFGRARGNLGSSALVLNPGVAIGQTPSYITAANVVDADCLAHAAKTIFAGKGKGLYDSMAARDEVIAKYSPLMWDRTHESKIIKGDAHAANRIMNSVSWLTNWITAMDHRTVSAIWDACEYQIQKNCDPNYIGSDAYYTEVAELWNEAIETTQPDYEVMQRPDILRSPNEVTKAMTMFMTVRLQNYNVMYQGLANWKQAGIDYKAAVESGNTEAVNAAKTNFDNAKKAGVKAVGSVIMSNAVYSVVRTAVDGIMHNWKKLRDDDDEITPQSVFNRLLWMFGETMAGCIPLGSPLFAVLEAGVTGDYYYGISANGISTISETLEKTVELLQEVSDDDDDPIWNEAADVLTSGLELAGCPVNNGKKLVKSIHDIIGEAQSIIAGNPIGEYGVERTQAQEASRMVKALESGDIEKLNGIIENINAEAETKVNGTTAEGMVKSWTGNQYSKGKIDRFDALHYLKAICDMSAEDAEQTVLGWDCKKDTGYSLSDLAEAYRKGEISRETYVDAETKYGGYTLRVAEEKAKTLDWMISNKDYKNISESDVNAVLDGVVPTDALDDYLAVKETAADANITLSADKNGNVNVDYKAIDKLVSGTYAKLYENPEYESVIDKLDKSYSRLNDLYEAAQLGIDAETWFSIYDVYKEYNGSDYYGSESNQKMAFQNYLSTVPGFYDEVYGDRVLNDKAKLMLDQMKFAYGGSVGETKIDDFVSVGLGMKAAAEAVNAVINLEPLAGEKEVSSVQKVRAIADTGLSENDKLGAISQLVTDSQYEKYVLAMNNGLSFAEFTRFVEVVDEINKAAGKDGYSQARMRQALDRFGWNDITKNIIWHAYLNTKTNYS